MENSAYRFAIFPGYALTMDGIRVGRCINRLFNGGIFLFYFIKHNLTGCFLFEDLYCACDAPMRWIFRVFEAPWGDDGKERWVVRVG